MNKINQIMKRLHSPSFASLFIRVAIGLVFINSGWFKVANIDAIVGFFGMMGIPPFLTYIVSYAEFIGGILFILGLFVRYVGVVTSIIMLVALIKVHLPNGYHLANNGYEYVLVLLLCSLAMITLGAGKYSIEYFFNRNKEVTDLSS